MPRANSLPSRLHPHESNEEPQVVSLVRQISGQLQLRAFSWTVTEGLQAFDPGDQPQTAALRRGMSQDELLAEIKQTRPLSVLMAEKVQEIRDWAADRTVPCD
jgi:hypothetical protein